MDDQDAADIDNLIRDIKEGTLGKSRHDFDGKGYGLDDDDDDDDDRDGMGRRRIGRQDRRLEQHDNQVDEQLMELGKSTTID